MQTTTILLRTCFSLACMLASPKCAHAQALEAPAGQADVEPAREAGFEEAHEPGAAPVREAGAERAHEPGAQPPRETGVEPPRDAEEAVQEPAAPGPRGASPAAPVAAPPSMDADFALAMRAPPAELIAAWSEEALLLQRMHDINNEVRRLQAEDRKVASLRLGKGLAITGGALMGAGVVAVLAVLVGDVAQTRHGEAQLVIVGGSLGAHLGGAALLATGVGLRRRQKARLPNRATIVRLAKEHEQLKRKYDRARARRISIEKRSLTPQAYLAPHGGGLALRLSL